MSDPSQKMNPMSLASEDSQQPEQQQGIVRQQQQQHPHQALFDSIPQNGLKCDILFLVIKNRIKEEPEYVKRLRVVFQFNMLKNNQPAATWTCDTKSCIEGDIYKGPPKPGCKADCILTVDDDDWVKIMVGKLNPQRAFMMSKFKIKGNIMLLQKLYALWFELRRKGKTPEIDLIQEIMVEEQLMPGLKSEAMAIEIVQRIVKMPHLAETIDANIQLNILKDTKLMTKYLIGMHPGKKPEFRRLYNALLSNEERKQLSQKLQRSTEATVAPKADIIFTIEDDDLVLVIYGIYKVNTAIETGRLKVEGKFELVDQARALFEQPPIMANL
uniref:Peroxisomal multifunctional enzyme type 2 n=1 Tax=Aceria tosichella TaxID=561515 RepID=A0A6G1SEX1_9ACAR